uniref:Uncharacterized protein n=1 Tax=viral metagenome TaxID=1070528 RepID=A0A6H1ZKG1_9ZZZZ
MAEIRYGHCDGPGHGREYAFKANIYIGRRSGKFVRLVNGHATLCASGALNVLGWAETPKDTTGKNSYKTSSTKAKDKMFVITGLDNVFEMPCDETIASLKSINATFLGQGAAIVVTGATHAVIQKAKIKSGNNSASQLYIVDYDLVNHTVRVKIKPAKKQG